MPLMMQVTMSLECIMRSTMSMIPVILNTDFTSQNIVLQTITVQYVNTSVRMLPTTATDILKHT